MLDRESHVVHDLFKTVLCMSMTPTEQEVLNNHTKKQIRATVKISKEGYLVTT